MKISNFQIILIIFFIASAIFGVLVFAGAIPIGKKGSEGGEGTVVLWGTVKTGAIFEAIQEFNNANTNFVVQYVEKSPGTFDRDLLEALASGKGPDMFFVPDNLAFHYRDKIATIPYSSYPAATFKKNFASAGDVFLNGTGMLAFPMSIDPLVMYYNQSMFDASAVVYPPATWDDLLTVTPLLTKKDDANKILKGGVAIGQYSNVANAKEIVAAMFMQTGNPIVKVSGTTFNSALNDINVSGNLAPVLNFYTSFSNPSKSIYTWNKSFSNSMGAFSAENVAIYFGFASELQSLINKNPNQNFFVAPIPQIKNSPFKLTNANVTGLALLSSSKNLNTAFIAASLMATGPFAEKFRIAAGAPPARRDILVGKPEDPFAGVFYDSALIARSWIDPSPEATNNIFRTMIDGVLSNNFTPDQAVRDANGKLELLLIK